MRRKPLRALAATSRQVRTKLAEYRAIGLDEIVIGGIDDADSVAAVLAAARDRP